MSQFRTIKKYGNDHGSWTLKDKLIQYRGVTKLYAQDKKLRQKELSTLKSKYLRDFENLNKEVNNFRIRLSHIIKGNQNRLKIILQQYKDFQLISQSSNPKDIFVVISQNTDDQRRRLDRICFEEKQVSQRFMNLKLEQSKLLDVSNGEQDSQSNYVQQRLVVQIQQSVAKENAAKAIRTSYRSILNILKNDQIYSNMVLDSMREDQRFQGHMMFKTTIMGQLAAENIDDIKNKCKDMEREISVNLKERERTLDVARERLGDIWEYNKCLIRVESDIGLPAQRKWFAQRGSSTPLDDDLERQITHLNNIFLKVKDSFSLGSYHELFQRIEDQAKNKQFVMDQHEEISKKRDAYVKETSENSSVLEKLQGSIVASEQQFQRDQEKILEEISIERSRGTKSKNIIKDRGGLLIDIRMGLQNILDNLNCVTGEDLKASDMNDTDVDFHWNDIEQEEEFISRLVEQVNALVNMCDFEFDPEKEREAHELYQTHISDYQSQLKFRKSNLDDVEYIVEAELNDPTVMTRANLKHLSKQIVETNLRNI